MTTVGPHISIGNTEPQPGASTNARELCQVPSRSIARSEHRLLLTTSELPLHIAPIDAMGRFKLQRSPNEVHRSCLQGLKTFGVTIVASPARRKVPFVVVADNEPVLVRGSRPGMVSEVKGSFKLWEVLDAPHALVALARLILTNRSSLVVLHSVTDVRGASLLNSEISYAPSTVLD